MVLEYKMGYKKMKRVERLAISLQDISYLKFTYQYEYILNCKITI